MAFGGLAACRGDPVSGETRAPKLRQWINSVKRLTKDCLQHLWGPGFRREKWGVRCGRAHLPIELYNQAIRFCLEMRLRRNTL